MCLRLCLSLLSHATNPNDPTVLCSQVNDRYEFFDELDLDMENGRLLSPNADHTVRNLYKLFAVLVSVGCNHLSLVTLPELSLLFLL